jgi:hypothetical protein
VSINYKVFNQIIEIATGTTRRFTRKKFKRGLKQFRTATKQYHEHHMPSGYILRLSDGCEYLRMNARGYWIFDAIASFQKDQRIQPHPFQFWEFKLGFGDWLVECINAEYKTILSDKIGYARFPLDTIEIVVVEGTAFLLSEFKHNVSKTEIAH